jgi:hypothetical protein
MAWQLDLRALKALAKSSLRYSSLGGGGGDGLAADASLQSHGSGDPRGAQSGKGGGGGSAKAAALAQWSAAWDTFVTAALLDLACQ